MVGTEGAAPLGHDSLVPGDRLGDSPGRDVRAGQPLDRDHGVWVTRTEDLVAGGSELRPVLDCGTGERAVVEALADAHQQRVQAISPEQAAGRAPQARGTRPQTLAEPRPELGLGPDLQ